MEPKYIQSRDLSDPSLGMGDTARNACAGVHHDVPASWLSLRLGCLAQLFQVDACQFILPPGEGFVSAMVKAEREQLQTCILLSSACLNALCQPSP